jgi:hypothetical protein
MPVATSCGHLLSEGRLMTTSYLRGTVAADLPTRRRASLLTRVRALPRPRPELAALLVTAAFLNLWSLDTNGYANEYYSAAVRSMSESWHAFLYGSFDSAGVMTVDKPPLALWVQALSVRAFGLSSWSILVSQALMGVAAVALTYDLARRRFGRAAGFVAGLVLAHRRRRQHRDGGACRGRRIFDHGEVPGRDDDDARELVSKDDATDVALLKIDASGMTFHPLKLGSSSSLGVGDQVAAIGDPFGYERSISTGIVSGLDRTVDAPNGFTVAHAIQTDAALNPGNSGGPLLDASGAVIGIVDQIATNGGSDQSSGVGFAVPIDLVKS